jgi:putative endonuclease
MEHPKFCVYVLYSLKDLQFYIGYTTNFVRRMLEHENGDVKSTAPRRPFIPIRCEYTFAKSDAMRREEYFKTSAGKSALRLMLKDSLNEIKRAQP